MNAARVRSPRRPRRRKARPSARMPAARRRAANGRTPTEQRIIDATLELLAKDGLGALTTVSIARKAKIHQPNFYAYFRNIDDCLAAAAQYVAAHFRRFEDQSFAPVRRAVEEGGDYLAQSVRYHEEVLERLLSARAITELFLRHIHDTSAFGRELRKLEEQNVENVTAHLWDFGTRIGLRGNHLPEVRLLAEFHVSAMSTAVLSILEGRSTDVHAVARAVAANADATIRATFRRLLKEA
jgi:AcrR family transcriptional regulator